MVYLVSQILLCLFAAFGLGLFVGWLVWGRRVADSTATERKLREARHRIHTLEKEYVHPRESKLQRYPVPVQADTSGIATIVSETADAPDAVVSGPRPIRDDLQKISGIGPVVDEQLAGIGITTFRQIARFSDDDIERVGQHIDFFPDRIRREAWIEQAARFHREKYDTEP